MEQFCTSVTWYLCESLLKAVGACESSVYTNISKAWELKPGYCSRFEQTHLNNATILYERKSYCAPYVLLAVQIKSWKAKIFCTESPIEIKEKVQKITQIAFAWDSPFAWDSSFAQTLCTLEGKGRGNLISLQNLFKFPFHDLQPAVCDNGIGNCCRFWEGKHRNCGDYSMSRVINKIFSFFPGSPLAYLTSQAVH